MKSCEIVGGDPELAVPFAAGLEILHNFTLIHDDIMDNDSLRRGAPTVHSKWGIPVAIASGDLLFAKVYQAMYSSYFSGSISGDRTLKAIRTVTEATIRTCEGQVLDISYPNTKDVSLDDYIFMVGGKTSALFKACAEIGAIIGGGTPADIKRLGSFAWDAGISFQIVDDMLGSTGDEVTLGKPVGSDLREGKKTLIVIYALNNSTPSERIAILNVLGDENASSKDINKAKKVLIEIGAINYAKEKSAKYIKRAKQNLEMYPDVQARNDLVELVEYFSSREF